MLGDSGDRSLLIGEGYKMRFTKHSGLFVGCVAAAGLIAGSAHADHIDYLTDGGFVLLADTVTGTGTATSSQLGDPGNILGGERDVTVTITAGNSLVSVSALGAPIGPTPFDVGNDTTEQLAFDAGTGTAQLILNYDGIGGVGLGVDLTNGGAFASIIASFTFVQGAGDLTVEIEDTDGDTGSQTLAVAAAADYQFDFVNLATGGVDITSIDRVTLTLQSTIVASDFNISEITRGDVPEPASLALMAVGTLFMLRRRTQSA